MPLFQLQAEVFLALHDRMIPLLPQLRPLQMVGMDFGAALNLRSESLGSGRADHHPIACHFWVMQPGRWPWLRFPSLVCLAEAQTSEACG